MADTDANPKGASHTSKKDNPQTSSNKTQTLNVAKKVQFEAHPPSMLNVFNPPVSSETLISEIEAFWKRWPEMMTGSIEGTVQIFDQLIK